MPAPCEFYDRCGPRWAHGTAGILPVATPSTSRSRSTPLQGTPCLAARRGSIRMALQHRTPHADSQNPSAEHWADVGCGCEQTCVDIWRAERITQLTTERWRTRFSGRGLMRLQRRRRTVLAKDCKADPDGQPQDVSCACCVQTRSGPARSGTRERLEKLYKCSSRRNGTGG